MNIPEGYKLVPVKANCDQLHAGASKSGVLFIYEAMVKAAPAVELNAYDESKERELFEAFWSENMNLLEMDLHRHIYPMNSGWSYACHETNRSWMTWQACAKFRARSAE